MTDRRNALQKGLANMAGQKVLIVGDLMIDHYMVGSVERISPEAPVPVVMVEDERCLLGGAGNVARNVASLGGEPVLVGLRGNDNHGRQLEELLEKEGVKARLVVASDRPTTRKTRIIAHNQQVVRVDMECHDRVGSNVIDQVMDKVSEGLDGVSVIVVSDYGKGLVCREFMDRLHALADSATPRPAIFVDPKVRNFALYKGVDLLTPNTKETAECAGLAARADLDVARAGGVIFDKLDNKHLLVTLGADGMALFKDRDSIVHIPTAARKVFDVTGAGDTVIAVLALARSAGMDLLDSCLVANCAAGLVVAEVGAAAAAPGPLFEALAQDPRGLVTAWGGRET